MVRQDFLVGANKLAQFLRDDDLASRWDEPSVLPNLSIGALAAHTARSVITPAQYASAPAAEAAGDPLSPAEYFAGLLGQEPQVVHALNAGVIARATEGAGDGSSGVAQQVDDAANTLAERANRMSPEAVITVYGDLPMTLDDYLVTRAVELVVHSDDLAVSLGRPAPPLPPALVDAALNTLLQIGRLRRGDTSMIRALARADRAGADVLPVL